MAETFDPAILRGKAQLRMTYEKSHGEQYGATETKTDVVSWYCEKIMEETKKSGSLNKDCLLRMLSKIYSEAYQTSARHTVADVTGFMGYTTVY